LLHSQKPIRTLMLYQNAVTLEEIENVTGFVQNMDRIELPNQLVAVLADPLLQKLLLLRPNAEAYQRVANWLSSVLQNVIDGDADEATLWEVLDVVKEFVVQSKVSQNSTTTSIYALGSNTNS
jgi:centromere protein I